MLKRKWFVLILLVMMWMVSVAQAQDIQQPPPIEPNENTVIDPNANITWPPPIYVMRGTQFPILGSANLPDMTNFFVEYRPINNDLTVPDPAAPWFPALLPNTAAIQNDILGTWDTTTAPDGLYELRLTVNRSSGIPVTFRVSPVRVENNPPQQVVPQLQPTVAPPPTLAPPPTQPPSPTPVPTVDQTPRVTPASVNVNVRNGDSTAHPRVGSLLVGQEARILGISSTGSGWYLIELPNGRRGWVAPFVVTTAGDLSNLPFFNPPPPPPTATPSPTPIPTVASQVNLRSTGQALRPEQPVCNEEFSVRVNINNNGTQTSGQFDVRARDRHVASGTETASNTVTVPPLAPGADFLVDIKLTVSTFFNEEHEVRVNIDRGNQVPELSEDDNRVTFTYTLDQGSC
ncbi:MAG: hypothetical protein D6737_19205 [Chloroflexi bacterium]|nr:MAG: hypothetical protein D6737_19205 [Chloroflexota bacterium]